MLPDSDETESSRSESLRDSRLQLQRELGDVLRETRDAQGVWEESLHELEAQAGARAEEAAAMAELAAGRAALYEEGGPYEVDADELAKMVEEFQAIEANVDERYNPMWDLNSRIRQMWDDETNGIVAVQVRRASMMKLKRRVNSVLRPAAVGGALALGWLMRRPTQSVGFGFLLRLRAALILWPAVHLAVGAVTNAASRWKTRAEQPPPLLERAAAAQVIYTQYLLCSLSLPIRALLTLGGMPLAALLFATVAQPLIFASLWYWGDLTQEMQRVGGRWNTPAARAWKLTASVIALAEGALALRLFVTLANLKPIVDSAGLSWAQHGVEPSALLQFSGAVALAPQRYVQLCRELGCVAAVAYFWYASWFACFPTEAITRHSWRPSMLPYRRPIVTLGTCLMRALRISRLEPEMDEMIRSETVSTVAPRFEVNGSISGAVPSALLRLSPYDEEDLDAGLPISQTCELLDLLSMESWGGNASGKLWWEDPAAEAARDPVIIWDRTKIFDEFNMTALERMRFGLNHYSPAPPDDIQSRPWNISFVGPDDDPTAGNSTAMLVDTTVGRVERQGEQADRRLDGGASNRTARASDMVAEDLVDSSGNKWEAAGIDVSVDV